MPEPSWGYNSLSDGHNSLFHSLHVHYITLTPGFTWEVSSKKDTDTTQHNSPASPHLASRTKYVLLPVVSWLHWCLVSCHYIKHLCSYLNHLRCYTYLWHIHVPYCKSRTHITLNHMPFQVLFIFIVLVICIKLKAMSTKLKGNTNHWKGIVLKSHNNKCSTLNQCPLPITSLKSPLGHLDTHHNHIYSCLAESNKSTLLDK